MMILQRNLTVHAALVAAIATAFILGSSGLSEAVKKKKAAMTAAPAPTGPCFLTAHSPVCATKGKIKFSYANACYAAADGAKAASAGECKVKKAGKKGGAMKKAKKLPMKKK